jgi:hypothetical protein
MGSLEREGLLADTGERSCSELSGGHFEPTEPAKKLWGLKPSPIKPKQLN